MMLHGGRNVATPARAASSLFSALDAALLDGAGALLQQLPEELRQQARVDLARRLNPEIQARHPSCPNFFGCIKADHQGFAFLGLSHA
jgi:hypothetical protein